MRKEPVNKKQWTKRNALRQKVRPEMNEICTVIKCRKKATHYMKFAGMVLGYCISCNNTIAKQFIKQVQSAKSRVTRY